MLVIFEMGNWNPFYEAFDKNRVSCLIFKCFREVNTFIMSKVLLEYDEIIFLDVEINLIDQGLL